MAELPFYKSLEEKATCFYKDSHIPNNRIETEMQFDSWYGEMKKYATQALFFRGAGEAKYKLYTSAQRTWIEQKKEIGEKKYYRQFFKDLLLRAREEPVLKKVIDFYGLGKDENTLSLMSLLQHYGGTTTFLDWTYNIDVALFFAIGDVRYDKTDKIENFSSVYLIDNSAEEIKLLEPGQYKDFHHLLEANKTGIGKTKDEQKKSVARLRYLTEPGVNQVNVEAGIRSLANTKKAYQLSVFNQNIITQDALFIFNPSRTIPLEEYNFSKTGSGNGGIRCYNTHKKLSGYIRNIIEGNTITKNFIYPNMSDIMGSVSEKTISQFFK